MPSGMAVAADGTACASRRVRRRAPLTAYPQEAILAEPTTTHAAGLAPGDAVRIHTDDPALEDVNGLSGRVVHCEDPGPDSAVLAHGCLVELEEAPRRQEPRRVWVTIDKLVRL